MKTLRHYFTISFIFLIAISSYAQTNASISGTVVDETTKEVLIAASIALYQNEVFVKGAVANLEGQYFIKLLKPGKYQMEVSYLGYATEKTEIELKGDIEKTCNLKEGLIMEEVVISCFKMGYYNICTSICGSNVTSHTDCWPSWPKEEAFEELKEEEEPEELLTIKKEASFFPNPSSGQVNFKSETEITEMELRSVTGKLLWTKRIDAQTGTLDLSGLPTGYYIVRYVEDGLRKSRKLVKVSH